MCREAVSMFQTYDLQVIMVPGDLPKLKIEWVIFINVMEKNCFFHRKMHVEAIRNPSLSKLINDFVKFC